MRTFIICLVADNLRRLRDDAGSDRFSDGILRVGYAINGLILSEVAKGRHQAMIVRATRDAGSYRSVTVALVSATAKRRIDRDLRTILNGDDRTTSLAM